MHKAKPIMLVAPLLGASACAGQGVEIRTVEHGVTSERIAHDPRIAEAEGHMRLGNVALAIESYRKALRLDPDSKRAHLGIAAGYDHMGRADLSARHYELALASDPTDPKTYRTFAASRARVHDREGAESLMREAMLREAALQADEPVALAQAALPAPQESEIAATLETSQETREGLPEPVRRTAERPRSDVSFELSELATDTHAVTADRIAAIRPSAAAPSAVLARGMQAPVAPRPPALATELPAALADPTPAPVEAPAPIPLPRSEAALQVADMRLQRLNAGEVLLTSSSAPVFAQAAPAPVARRVASAFRRTPKAVERIAAVDTEMLLSGEDFLLAGHEAPRPARPEQLELELAARPEDMARAARPDPTRRPPVTLVTARHRHGMLVHRPMRQATTQVALELQQPEARPQRFTLLLDDEVSARFAFLAAG